MIARTGSGGLSAFVARGPSDGAETETRLTAFMRYAGQGWEIPVPAGKIARFADG